ncbi:hypothetical protein, partial [Thauera propionica]|uniref:hypothetical protein n=1 Tax=Thauera propionica TaxID=2019431 RepID=UPI00197DACDE
MTFASQNRASRRPVDRRNAVIGHGIPDTEMPSAQDNRFHTRQRYGIRRPRMRVKKGSSRDLGEVVVD